MLGFFTQTKGKSSVEEILDHKEFKKVLKTKNNVLVCFHEIAKQSAEIFNVLRDVGEKVKGLGTIVSLARR